MRIDGNKTYIAIVLFAVLNGLLMAGVISQDLYESLLKILGMFGLYAVRSAIKKAEK